MSHTWGRLSSVFLRCALGLGFLSAVADRFGLWGAFGQPNVEWGNFSRFLEYTHSLNWYVPAKTIPPLGAIAACAEPLFGLLLLVRWHTRAVALSSGLLLLSFGVAMTVALGVKAPLNLAVFTRVGGAWLFSRTLRQLSIQCGRAPVSPDPFKRSTHESRTTSTIRHTQRSSTVDVHVPPHVNNRASTLVLWGVGM